MHSFGLLAVAASLLSAVNAVPANAVAFPYDIDGKLVNGRSVKERAVCYADNVLRALRNPTRSVAASAFCSDYIRSTLTARVSTTATNVISRTSTSLTTTTTVSTQVDTSTTTRTVSETSSFTSTTTAATPTQTITETCTGLRGFGNAAFDVFQDNSGAFGTFTTCQAQCLTIPSAVAFGFGLTTCACYSARVADFVNVVPSTPYAFYDIGCPNPVVPQPKVKRAPKPIPTYLSAANGNPISVSSACSCFISAASAAVTTTNTLSFTTSTTKTSSTTRVSTISTATTTTTTLQILETSTTTTGTTTTITPAPTTITTTVLPVVETVTE